MHHTGNRRTRGEVALRQPVHATVQILVDGTPLDLSGRVVRATARTVVIELPTGVSALAVAMMPRCELTLWAAGVAIRAAARPGRRTTDGDNPRQISLVILDGELDLGDVL